ncbi:hypothetical protein NDU88_003316 [Pleurodeles waltl]|uniref:Uncharacterized protein n=1 Tax=Pleurodeles waltl TaxID=8319 RepID=A0AAV7VFF4_PLEWA|nr:hypothetical protein NDU88_003316 [Pleurodeles waltl]
MEGQVYYANYSSSHGVVIWFAPGVPFALTYMEADVEAPEGPAERLLAIALARAALPRGAGAELRTVGRRGWSPAAVPVQAAVRIWPTDESGGLRLLPLLGAAASSIDAGRGSPMTAAAAPGPLC